MNVSEFLKLFENVPASSPVHVIIDDGRIMHITALNVLKSPNKCHAQVIAVHKFDPEEELPKDELYDK
jgi:hypothetical protein